MVVDARAPSRSIGLEFRVSFAFNIFSFATSAAPAAALAQVRGGLSNEERSEIFFWLGVISIIGIALVIGGFLLYRKLRKGTETTEEEAGFSISHMRRLYEAGELSHEEYMHLREKLLAASRASMLGERDAKLSAAPGAAPAVAPEPAVPQENEVADDHEDDHETPPNDADNEPKEKEEPEKS